MSAWRVVTNRADVPPRGCYAVYHDGALVYIGSSAHLYQRIGLYLAPRRTHMRQQMVHGGARRRFGVVVTVKVSGSKRLGDWLMREYRLIHRLAPRDNRKGSGSYRRDAEKAS